MMSRLDDDYIRQVVRGALPLPAPDAPWRCAPGIPALYRFWRDEGRTGLPPMWRNDAVHDLKPWIGNLLIVGFEGNTAFHRLSGTNIVDRLGVETTGQRIDCAFGGAGAPLAEAYGRTRERRQPCYAECRIIARDGDAVAYQRLLLPFRGPSGRVERLLGLVHFATPSDGGGAPREIEAVEQTFELWI